MDSQAHEFDVAIVGAGPAGCSCALWLQEIGLRCALIDQAPVVCSLLDGFSFRQDWVLCHPDQALAEIAQGYAAHLQRQPGVTLHLRTEVLQVRRAGARVQLSLTDGTQIRAQALVAATGMRPRHPKLYFGAATPDARVLDAISLTQQRAALRNQNILLLGGGDNAVENAIYLNELGNRVTLWSRSALKAGAMLVRTLQQRTGIECRIGCELPAALDPRADRVVVRSAAYGEEAFDQVAVLFGFEPALDWLHTLEPDPRLGAAWPELFYAGDVSQRLHPCVHSALADGVTAAKQIQRWIESGAVNREGPAMNAATPLKSPWGNRILTLTGLRFDASLGILEHEHEAPQPIQVDAELNLGGQSLLPRDDEIHHVLDYRKVRQIIISECTAEHMNLLESLIGKLAARLMQLPGVLGVRVKIAKLEIFDDCEVAIRVETGQW